MKIKMLKNFKSNRVIVKEGQIFDGEIVARMDETYSIKTLVDKGIVEIIDHETTVETDVKTIDHRFDDIAQVVETPAIEPVVTAKKKTTKKVK